ncbi:MAG: glycosyltransferase [Pseudomonadota bacterium]
MRLTRIALFARHYSVYDYSMLRGLATGFMAAGTETVFLPRLLNADELRGFCATYRPDAVLEINRNRADAEGLPDAVRHIAWIQDPPHHRAGQDLGCASDLNYFMTCPDAIGYAPGRAERWGLLFTGIDTRFAFPGEQAAGSDFSIIGFLPPPVGTHELYGEPCPGTALRFGEIFDAYAERYWAAMTHGPQPPVSHAQVMALFDDCLRGLTGHDLAGLRLEPDTRRQVEFAVITLISRSPARRALADTVLRVSGSLRIYGNADWQKWPAYAPYYRGYLDGPSAVCDVLRGTRLNLHNNMNGFSMHSRVLDSMACGRPILVESSPFDTAECGIARHFEPWVHYLPFTFDTLEGVARQWLEDEAGRRRMGQAAARAVQDGHTWRDRARQIQRDYESL